MPTSHTKVTIYNMALDGISELPVSTLEDASTYVRWLNRNYPHYVQMALRENPWNFAVELHELNAEPVAPTRRWRYKYGLPPGWLRVLKPTLNGDVNSQPLPYEVSRNFLYMNDAPPRPVRIVMDEQDPGEWDPLFAAAIAARLAAGMAYRFTGKASYAASAEKAANEAIALAKEIDAIEGDLPNMDEYNIIAARYGA